VCQPTGAVEALRLQTAVSKHLYDLCIFWDHCQRERTSCVTATEDVPWPSSLKVNSRFSLSFSFFPLLLFLPPCLPR
jgi:hypothetical protein